MNHVPVWDLSVRIFHWSLVLLVAICIITGGERGWIFFIHAYAGYVVLLFLVFRLGWGFAGSRHALFSDFVYSWSTTRRYATGLLRLKPERHIGHNPLGGWMIVLMLAVMVGSTVTGIVTITTGTHAPKEIHEALGNVIQILVAVHILGVIADWVLTRDNIVRAMITGRKEMPDDDAQREPSFVPTWRAIVIAVVVAAAGIYLFQRVDYPTAVASFAEKQDRRGATENSR